MEYNCSYCKKEMNLIGEKHGYRIYKCPDCSFISADVRNYNPFDIYGEGYLSGKYKGTQSFYNNYFSKEKQLREKSMKILEIINKKETNLFEMGCGAGFFLDEAKKSGHSCYGTETSIEGIDYCKKLNLNTELTDKIPKERFNVCVAIDVIEHLQSPFEVLKKLYNISLDTLVIETIFTDDIEDYINWSMMQPPRHISFLTRKHIIELFNIEPEFYKVAYGTLCVWRKR